MTKRALIWVAVSSQIQAGDDKVSLAQQESEARAYCVARNWEVLAVLRVPGHSRSKPDLVQALNDFRAAGITAYDELQKHWQARSADILVAYTYDRLGRSITQSAYIAECSIEAGMEIHLLYGDNITESNIQYQIAFGGLMASSHISALKRGRKIGVEKRLELGLIGSGRPPLSHINIRDHAGKSVRTEVNEALRRLWDDLATLILEGVPWRDMPARLEQWGHLNQKTGKPYAFGYLYRLVYNPLFWGHTAAYHMLDARIAKGRVKARTGAWVYDESVPAPKSYLIHRNKVPAVWTGELAEQVKAELRRRELLEGHASAYGSHRFSGLVVCGRCGYAMATDIGRRKGKKYPNSRSVRCSKMRLGQCDNHHSVRYSTIQAYLDALLKRILELKNLSPIYIEQEDNTQQIILLKDDLTQLEAQLRTLIREQATAQESVQEYYRSEVVRVGNQIQNTKDRLTDLETTSQQQQYQETQKIATLAEIQTIQMVNFWQQEDRVINQLLLRLFGNLRLVAEGNAIAGLTTGQFHRRKVDG